jgi:hypothetical protein
MENKSEPVEQPAEREQTQGGWVRRPNVSSEISNELKCLTRADSLTPEMLEVLHQLMVRVQEAEAANEPIERECPTLAQCATYRADSCSSLASCGTFTRPT